MRTRQLIWIKSKLDADSGVIIFTNYKVFKVAKRLGVH